VLSNKNNVVHNHYKINSDTTTVYKLGKDSIIHITRTQIFEKPIPYIVYIDSSKYDSTLCDSIRKYTLRVDNDTVSIHNNVVVRGELLRSEFKYNLRLPYRVDTLERTITNTIQINKKNNLYLFGSLPLGAGIIYTRDRFLCGYNYQVNLNNDPLKKSHNIFIGYRLFSK
jgi:hypothetical protein